MIFDLSTFMLKQLGFVHPVTGEMLSFDSTLPKEFEELLQRLREDS